MNLLFGIQTAFEIALVVAVFWGIFHEDKLIAFEKRLGAALKRRKLRVVKNTNTYYALNLNHQ